MPVLQPSIILMVWLLVHHRANEVMSNKVPVCYATLYFHRTTWILKCLKSKNKQLGMVVREGECSELSPGQAAGFCRAPCSADTWAGLSLAPAARRRKRPLPYLGPRLTWETKEKAACLYHRLPCNRLGLHRAPPPASCPPKIPPKPCSLQQDQCPRSWVLTAGPKC